MKFAAWPGLAAPWAEVVEISQHLERTGWDGLYYADHFMPNQEDVSGPTQECWTSVSAIAALVPRVRIGTLVTGNTYRHPAVLAKMAAQVDIVSGGRLVFGLGAAWQQNEHEKFGIEFGTVGWRMKRMEESVQIIKSMFANDRTTFAGKHYTVTDAPLVPKPIQRPGPPLLIGGGGEQVTLRIAAKYADEWNVWGSPSTLARKGAVLEQHCEKVGRDPKTIRRSCQALVMLSDDASAVAQARERSRQPMLSGSVDEVVETLGQYREAGVDEFIVPAAGLGSFERLRETYDRLMQDVVPQLR
ncbi:MAG: TIGR03560 family F420-dependent LLM class oxidoreductase [Chloroflexi bacterium]|nr:TIGR03560 family F420-dependent LLM class oxidoreductase [Chloroflexota bacterium]MDA1239572.1 TIGR03560 family F420-dependent LLM class oxidoreductase [Chloroflexota bacterium]